MKLEVCEPPRWAASGHAQTIFGHLLPSPSLRSKGQRVEVPLPDGDVLVGFVQPGTSGAVVYVFHGLAGSTDSTYMHRTSILAQKRGHTVILFNHRGCGEGRGLARLPYHSGRAEDLSAVIEFGRREFPTKRHMAIGFSLSGNALLLLLSGKRGRVQPDVALSVNAPIHLAESSALLRRGLNRIYDIKFYRQCRQDILKGPERHKWLNALPQLVTLHEFDQLYTAPTSGFLDREDYYSSCSTHSLMSQIQIPTILLTAKDDPLVPVENYQNAVVSRHVDRHIESFGGHMGYISRSNTPMGSKRWQDYAVDQAMNELIG